MTVILVLSTFVLFLLIDYLYSKRLPVRATMQVRPQPASRPAMQPNVVGGFIIPGNLRYHPGHTWALSESPKLVRVGFDDFAARVMGKIESITLPQRGQWIRQGQKIWTIQRNGVRADMVSPVEGVVTEINEAAAQNPDVSRSDPYGDGWLVTVESPDAKLNFRNLLAGNVARMWMEEAANRLRKHMQIPAGAMADGGMAVNDLTSSLAEDQWLAVTREFFLS